MEYIIGLIVVFLIAAVVIWIVGKLGLGMEVDGFGPAIIAAIAIAVVSTLVTWLLNTIGLAPGGGWLGALVSLVISAVVLLIADRFVRGMRVNGFVGAIVAAIAIGVVSWLVALLLAGTGLLVGAV